jgi:succinyl-diaminopimelate desuccinylase
MTVPKRQKTDEEKLFDFIDNLGSEAISLMAGLVQRKAIAPVNGGQGEKEKADFLEEYLKALGLGEVQRFSRLDKGIERPNLIMTIKGNDQSMCLWLVSHLDVVPEGDRAQWKDDPFKLKVEGDKLVGRGTEDNNQGIVSSILATKAVRAIVGSFPINIGLLFLADEETGSEFGIKYLLREHRALFGAKDAFIVPDAGNEDGSLIEVAEKSLLWLKIRVVGKQTHASTPHLGKNATVIASKLIVKLGELYDKFDLRAPVFDPPYSTFEVTKREPNVPNINTIPGDDVFYMDCRILPQTSADDVIAFVREVAQGIAREERAVVQVEQVMREDAAPPTPEDAELVLRLKEAIRQVYRVEAKAKGIGGATIASFLRREGFPVVVWGRMDETGHRANEYAWLSNILGDAKVFAKLMMDYQKKEAQDGKD